MKLLIVISALLISWPANAEDHLVETRYCGEPKRNTEGRIRRSMATVKYFKELYPCEYPCDNTWRVDHVIPLAVGGCDAVRNMQWLPPTIKNCSGAICKDRWERKLYPTKF